MCGISGIINKTYNKVDNKEIKKINDMIAHRGPDDEGFFLEKNFAFGHRRLSILDLSSDGHQPMSYQDKYTITYNGEVYNYIEIKKELVEGGYCFTSNTDTEVILAAYDKWGQNCVNKFNGMWAFAIFDKEEEIIFCSRDRFGIKPFYYTEIDNKFLFGSEIKQLLEYYEKNIVNKKILADYLSYGLEEHTNETFFKGVYKLEQSHNLIYDLNNNTYEIKKYFDLDFDPELNLLSEDDSIKHLKIKLETAIDLRLRSDVKVGTCLSGGLDSSSIAAIASKKYYANTGNKFVAIHAKSIEQKTDESFFAREVMHHCDLDMVEVEPQLDDITNSIEEVVYTQEEPFGGPSIFMQYFVMKKARENGCIVMLDGQGGDEALFGYENYYSVYFASLISNFELLNFFNELFKLKTFKVPKRQVLKSTVSVLLGNKMRYLKSLLGINQLKLKIEYEEKKLSELYEFKNFKDFQRRELMKRNLPHLLRYEDKNSMRHSVETRLPFVDYIFVKSSVSMNDRFKFKNGYLKYLLRKAVEDMLPLSIVWRTNKFGFEAPEDLWFEKHKEVMISEIRQSVILDKIIVIEESLFRNKKLLWRMYNIAIWEKIYKVKFS